MKRILTLLLIIAVLVATFASIVAASTAVESTLLTPGEGAEALDGKSIIFIGNDHTSYGGVVEATSASDANSIYSKRVNDPGYFKHICTAAGIDTTVVDWAMSGHKLSQLLSDECSLSGSSLKHTEGRSHLDDLTKRDFDYVVIQGTNEGYTTAEAYYATAKSIMDIFKTANPNVKILYTIPPAAYTSWGDAFLESISLIKEEGAVIIDWGALIDDVYMGRTTVPGATEDYNKSSFIISKSSTSSYPNLLGGYIYAQMVWCAITGETAVGQSYQHVLNYTGKYSISTFTSDNYTYDNSATTDVDESKTNMGTVFNSANDMAGIQALCDSYLVRESWKKCTITFLDSDGGVISSEEYSLGEEIVVPTPPTKPANENFAYIFKGWDKAVDEICCGNATYTAVYELTMLKEWGTFAPGSNLAALDGKKILFAGCSYTYYGGVIEQSASDVYIQSSRTTAENGYFKRLCKHYGIDVTVTDWVFGGHDLTDIFDGSCAAGSHDGHDHLADLVDRNYDYVVLQEILVPGYKTAEQYYENTKRVMDIFLEENPNTKFFYSLHNQVYAQSTYDNEWKKHIQMLADDGVTMINWGAAVYDAWMGNTEIPGAELDYNKQSFIVSNNSSDGYHPTLLSGYVNLVMTWSAITGESPIGQPVEFIRNCTGKYLGIDKFIELHFKYDNPITEIDERETNMGDAMRSDTEMLAFQKLAAKYLNKARWLDFIEYTIEFKDADGTLLKSELLKYGDTVTPPTVPTKEADTNYTYTFIGWDKEVTTCEGDCVYTATYSKSRREYQITFIDDDGTTLLASTCYGGSIPTPPSVADKSDDTYRYIFCGWDKEITACEGDTTYEAQYIKLPKGIVVTFKDYDGRVISAQSYTTGDTIVVPETPARAADSTFNYTFAGWDKDIDYTPVTDATYTATYSSSYIDYTIIFKDEDGTVISEATYHYGDVVVVPTSPSKAANETYTYTFSGWGSTVNETCEGNATYTASYAANYIIYSITFFDTDGEVILTRTYHFGDRITIPKPPIKPTDNPLVYRYDFTSWGKEVSTTCQGSTSYTAVYALVHIEYEVVFKNDDGSVISNKLYHYGEEIEIPVPPTKESDGTYEYSFVGWGESIDTCTKDAEYTAQFEAIPISGATPDNTPDGKGDGPAIGLIVGISIGAVAALGVGVFSFLWFVIRKKRSL